MENTEEFQWVLHQNIPFMTLLECASCTGQASPALSCSAAASGSTVDHPGCRPNILKSVTDHPLYDNPLLAPYTFFDVSSGREARQGRSLRNQVGQAHRCPHPGLTRLFRGDRSAACSLRCDEIEVGWGCRPCHR